MFNLINFIKSLFFRKRENKEPDFRDGLLPSPTDFRDINIRDILGSIDLAPLPEKYRIPYILTIKNQGNTPHCVGYACASLKEYLEKREGNSIEFDGDWIYKKCKEIDGIPDISGTHFRAGLKVLQKIGAKPLNGKEEDAEKYRIGGYIRVDCDFKSLKQAIYEFGTVLIGFRGSNEGWKTAFIRKPKIGEPVWGHAAIEISYVITYIDGQNSWSEKWGNEGLFHFTQDYLPFEAWAIPVDLPNNWKELLKETEQKPKYFFQNNLYAGLRNEEIKILQDCLKFLGCLNKEQESTGYFGTKTFEAVKIFQKRYSISPVSGFVGPLTREKLNQLFA